MKILRINTTDDKWYDFLDFAVFVINPHKMPVVAYSSIASIDGKVLHYISGCGGKTELSELYCFIVFTLHPSKQFYNDEDITVYKGKIYV
jgi:hypothetical protein